MNETLIKNSILKKTVKVRDNINTTPSSNKSVRFHGVEFMIIADEESERGSFIDQNDDDPFSDGLNRFEELPNAYKSNISYNALPANTRINLFRVHTNNNQHHYQNQTSASNDGRFRATYPNGTIQTRVTKDLSNNALNVRRWSQAFSKNSSLKPPIYPKNRTLQIRNSYNRVVSSNASNRINSSSSVASAQSIISLNKQSNNSRSSTPTNENLNTSLTTSNTPLMTLNGTTYPLTTVQSSPNLSLYSYLLQSDTTKKDKEINPSSMRSQTKKLSCDEINVKPFMPRIQQTTTPTTITTTSTILNNSPLRLSNPTPFLQSYMHSSAGTTRGSISLRNTINITNPTNASKPTKKGGIIHVNTHNLSYLTSTNTVTDDNKTNLKHTNTDELLLRITPSTATTVHAVNTV